MLEQSLSVSSTVMPGLTDQAVKILISVQRKIHTILNMSLAAQVVAPLLQLQLICVLSLREQIRVDQSDYRQVFAMLLESNQPMVE